MKPEWRHILEQRSVADKIAIAIDCDLCEPGDIPIISELVRNGYMIWIDRTVLRHIVAIHRDKVEARIGINVDVYLLTLKGIKLCNENGIKQR